MRKQQFTGLIVLLAALLILGGPARVVGQEPASPRADRAAEFGWFDAAAHAIALSLEIAGIAIIVGGGLIATVVCVRRLIERDPFGSVYQQYRANLGRGILLGLEFLVGADIIGTVAVEPTFSNLGVLGLIVLIRTFLSFALEVEINGYFPWRAAELDPNHRQHDPL